MVKCPICGKDFDTKRGMKIHKGRTHGEEGYIKKLEEQEAKKYREWRPEIAMVTVVGILSILLLLAVSAMSINKLNYRMENIESKVSGSGETFVPNDIDQAVCDLGTPGGANIIYEKMFYCANTTLCTPKGNEKVKILAIQAIDHEASTEQRKILKDLEQKDPEVDVEYYCASKEYLTCDWGEMFEDSELSEYYTIDQAPTLIMNCEYKRLGTYAAQNPEKERQELTELINALK